MQIINPTTKTGNKKPEIQFISNYELLNKIREQPPVEAYHTSSFPTMDRYLEGFEPGEVVVVSGPAGTGKTLFCQSLTKDLCGNGQTPLWFSFEMKPSKFLERFSMQSEDMQFVMPKELIPYSTSWVCEAIRQAKAKYDIEVAFIDNLHYVAQLRGENSISTAIGQIMKDLKLLAVKEDVLIFLIAHINKARIESLDDIGLHSIRDSSFISQESDIVLFIWNKIDESGNDITSRQIVRILKSRRTGMMFKSIPITKIGNYLVELAIEPPKQQSKSDGFRYTGGGLRNNLD